MIRFVSLFCGIGNADAGMYAAARKLGIEVRCVAAYDSDAKCVAVYNANMPHPVAIIADVKQMTRADLPPHDLIIGGPPCQDHSLAGKQKCKCHLGELAVERCCLADFVRLAGDTPYLMENVVSRLIPAPFSIKLNAFDFGDVTTRKRWFYSNYLLHVIETPGPRRFGDIRDHEADQIALLKRLPQPGVRQNMVDEVLGTVTAGKGGSGGFFKVGLRGHSASASASAFDDDEPLGSLIANSWHGNEISRLGPSVRCPSLLEMARAHSIPDSFDWCGATKTARGKMIANSWPIGVATAVCKAMLKTLDGAASNMVSTVTMGELIETSMSAIDTFTRCRRKYFYQEIKGWSSRTASWAMVMGTAYHAALAAGYHAVREYDNEGTQRNDTQRATIFLDYATEAAQTVAYDRDGKSLGLADEDRTLLEDMVRYWWDQVGERDLLNVEEVLSVEEPLYLQIGPYIIRCTLDRVIKYFEADAPTLGDHKTGDPKTTKEWTMFDTQTSTYYVAARGRWGVVQQFRHDFMNREVPPGFGHRSELTDTGRKRDPKKLAEMQEPSRYVATAFTSLSDAQLDAYTTELVEIIQEIDHAKETGRWTRTKIKTGPMSCDKCPYYDICRAERDGKTLPSDDIINMLYIVRGSAEWNDLQAGKIALKFEGDEA